MMRWTDGWVPSVFSRGLTYFVWVGELARLRRASRQASGAQYDMLCYGWLVLLYCCQEYTMYVEYRFEEFFPAMPSVFFFFTSGSHLLECRNQRGREGQSG